MTAPTRQHRPAAPPIASVESFDGPIPTWRRLALFIVPGVVTIVWVVFVLASGHVDRVAGHWRASLTMIFGSFVAGSTPQGGGAVAFPVFTKVLEVPPEVARTFSLSIQAIGMTVASVVILLARRTVVRRAVLVGGLSGIVGFVGALFLLGRSESPFWSPAIPGAYVKVTFTLLLAAMAFIVFLSRKDHLGVQAMPQWNTRIWVGMALAGLVGGVASALTGSGVDVLIFLFIVVLVGLHPRIGIPTSVLAMAFISVVGFVILVLVDGQMSVVLDASGDVASVGGTDLGGAPSQQFDLYGLWLASIPIVVWGAPLGTWAVASMPERILVLFVAVMALAEVVSTAIFLDQLHSDPALVIYAVVGLFIALVVISLAARHRHRLLGLTSD